MSRPIRTVLYCLLFLVAIVWLAARAAPPPLAASNAAELAVTAEQMEQTLASLRGEIAKGRRLVVVLGDSSLRWHPPLGANETLAAMLETEGERAGVTIRVVAHDGFDAVAYYLLVDEIAALRPEAVVLTANLQSFTDSWFRHPLMKHPQLAAFVRPARILEAIRLPLELAGINDASLVVQPALRLVGASALPAKIDGYRTRVRERLDAVLAGGAKTAMVGGGIAYAAPPPPATAPVAPPMGAARRAREPNAGRPGGQVLAKPAYRFMDLYPANLDREQSTVRVLGATVRDLVGRDVRTIVMLAPLHLQALRLTGAYKQRDLPRAVRVVDEVVVASGGTVVDLTEVLPQESFFVDRYTHFTVEGNRVVLDRLLEDLRRILGPDSHAAK